MYMRPCPRKERKMKCPYRKYSKDREAWDDCYGEDCPFYTFKMVDRIEVREIQRCERVKHELESQVVIINKP